MTNAYMPNVGSDRLSQGDKQHEHNAPKINMSDHNIRSVFPRTTDHSAVVHDDHISFGSPYPHDAVNHAQFSDQSNEGGGTAQSLTANETAAEGTTGKGTLNRCEITSGDSSTATGTGDSSTATGTGDSSTAGAGQESILATTEHD